jgi:hypothetical protein
MIAGQSSVTISQRYIHPTPEGHKRSGERYTNLNQEAAEKEENDKESRQYLLQSESGRL